MPMPSRSASCGDAIVTSRPSIAIVPASARCAPARIFINVDFPAPFSPTSANTSPERRSSETSFSARTPGNDFPMPRISSSGGPLRLLRLLRVGLGKGSDLHMHYRRCLLAGKKIANRVYRQGSDLLRILNRIAVHVSRLDGRSRFRPGIVPDNGDLSIESGGFDSGECSERGIVVDTEYALHVFVRLQHVAHRTISLRPFAAGIDVGNDLDPGAPGSNRRLEPFHAILNARHFGLVENGDGSGFTNGRANELARLTPALHVVACYV